MMKDASVSPCKDALMGRSRSSTILRHSIYDAPLTSGSSQPAEARASHKATKSRTQESAAQPLNKTGTTQIQAINGTFMRCDHVRSPCVLPALNEIATKQASPTTGAVASRAEMVVDCLLHGATMSQCHHPLLRQQRC